MTREPDGHHLGHRHRTGPPEGDWWPSRDDRDPEPQRRDWRGAKHSTDEEERK